MEVIDRQEIETVFTANMRQLETALIRYSNSIEASTRKAERAFVDSSRRISRSADRMNSDLRRAISVAAITLAGREVVKFGDDYVDMGNKIKVAGQVSGLEGRSLEALSVEAGKARTQLEPFVDLYSRILRSSKGLVDAEQEVADVTLTVSKAFAAGGAAAQEQAAGVLQLGQALGSGFLQGDELRSLRENAPLVAKAIADEFGVTIGELKKLGAEGEITSERVIRALQNQSKAIDAAFGATAARETNEAARAMDRFTLAVGRYVVESGGVGDASAVLAGAIDFVSNNLDVLTDAIVISAAALGGWLGAQAAASVIGNLSKMTKGVQGFARATALLRGVSTLFGGPLVIGVTLAAAALAYFALKGDGAVEAMDKLQGTLDDYRRTGERVQTDTGKLRDLNKELTDAIKNQQTTIEATKRAEISALSERIAKNRELLQVQRLLARAELGKVRSSIDNFTSNELSLGLSSKERARLDLIGRSEYKSVSNGDGKFGLYARDPEDQKRTFLTLLDQEVARNQEIEEAGGRLTAGQRAAYEIKADYLKLLDRERDLTEQVSEIGSTGRTVFPADLVREVLGTKPTIKKKPSTDDEDKKKAKRDPNLDIFDDLQEAYRQTFDTERETIQRTLDLRLEAIEKAKISDTDRALRRIEAEELYSAAIGKVNAEEAQYAEEAAKRAADQKTQDAALVSEALAVRDQAFGRTMALLDREYEERKAYYIAEIEDAADRNAALQALEETHQRNIQQIRQDALDGARDFAGGDPVDREVQLALEIDRVNRAAQDRIDAVVAAYDGEIEAHREAQDAIVAIQEEAADRIAALQQERLQGYVDDTASIFGSLAGVIETFGGKQSGAYKALIAVQRAFTFASLSIDIAQGIGKAITLGFPQNIPFIAAVTAQGAQALALLASAKGFQRGGSTGPGADSDVRGVVHANEYVNNAPTVRHYGVDVFEALRQRKIPKEHLRGFQRGGYAGSLPPAIQRVADRIPAQTLQAYAPVSTQVNEFNFSSGPVTVNGAGGDPAEIAARFESKLRDSEARMAAAIIPLVEADIRSGGGSVSGAIERAYAIGRKGA